MKKFDLVVVSMLLLLIQSSVLPFLFNGTTQPDIWLVFIILSALVLDKKTTFFFAVAGGLLQDVVIGNFFGIHFFPYLMVTLFLASNLIPVYTKHWYISIIFVMAGTFLCTFISLFPAYWGFPYSHGIWYWMYQSVLLTLYNGLMALLLHPLVWSLKKDEEKIW